MGNFDKRFPEAIVQKLRIRLGRSLTNDEFDAFNQVRSGIAYEMMMDYISHEEKSKTEIENYVETVTIDHKKTLRNSGENT